MVALEKSIRRRIFYAMVLAFAVLAPLAILYSQGYLVDFRSRGLVATGGIFVKPVQAGARVFVDSELKKELSFIARGALITDLLPRRYTVRVEKDGRRPWQKVVRVTDEEVLEFRGVLLPPATVTPRVIFTTRRAPGGSVRTVAGKPELALETGGRTGPSTVFVINPAARLAPTTLIQVRHWSWDSASESFTIGRSPEEGRMRWYRLAYRADGSSREEAVIFRGLPEGFSAERLTPHPSDPEAVYFFAGGALFLQGRSSVPVPIAEQLHTYAVTPDQLYFISKNGFFVASDLDGREAKVLGRKGLYLSHDQPVEIVASPRSDVAVRDSAGGLFLFQPERDQELELIAASVSGFDFDAAGDRLLYWDQNRLWIYWLRDNPRQPFDLARSRKQISFSAEPIRQASLNAEGTHVFFSTPKGIRMTEVDDRGSVNSYDLVSGDIPSFALDKEQLVLYWVEGTRLLGADLK